MKVQIPEGVKGIHILLIGRLGVPLEGLLDAGRNAATPFIHVTESGLRGRIVPGGRLVVPLDGLPIVRAHPHALFMEHAHPELRMELACHGRVIHPPRRLLGIARHALAQRIEQAHLLLGVQDASLGGFQIPFKRLDGIGVGPLPGGIEHRQLEIGLGQALRSGLLVQIQGLDLVPGHDDPQPVGMSQPQQGLGFFRCLLEQHHGLGRLGLEALGALEEQQPQRGARPQVTQGVSLFEPAGSLPGIVLGLLTTQVEVADPPRRLRDLHLGCPAIPEERVGLIDRNAHSTLQRHAHGEHAAGGLRLGRALVPAYALEGIRLKVLSGFISPAQLAHRRRILRGRRLVQPGHARGRIPEFGLLAQQDHRQGVLGPGVLPVGGACKPVHTASAVRRGPFRARQDQAQLHLGTGMTVLCRAQEMTLRLSGAIGLVEYSRTAEPLQLN